MLHAEMGDLSDDGAEKAGKPGMSAKELPGPEPGAKKRRLADAGALEKDRILPEAGME